MVNEERVKLMTRLAIYETTKGKKQLNISKYYKHDYVRFHMMKSAVTATLAFFMILGIYGLYQAEAILMQLNGMDFKEMLTRLGLWYALFVGLYVLASMVLYTYRYNKMKPDVIAYNQRLKKMRSMYEAEEKEIREKREGRSILPNDDKLNHY